MKKRHLYPNLRAEMLRRGIDASDIAKVLGVNLPATYGRFSGRTAWTIDNAFAVKNKFFPECSLEYLFTKSIER